MTAGVPCRRGCALATPVTAWAWVLDDDDPIAPAAWRLAYALVGLPHPRGVLPLPYDQWPDLLDAVERTYGREVVVTGLRHAAAILPIGGTYPWTASDAALAGRLAATLDKPAGVAA